METNESNSPPATATKNPGVSWSWVCIAVLLFGAGIFTGMQIERNNPPIVDPTHVTVPTPIAIKNSLAPRFTDTNGDLLADAPADPKRWQDPDTLVCSFVASKDSEKIGDGLRDLLDAIAKKTGKKCVYQSFASTAAQLEAIRDGRLQLAALNTGGTPAAVNLVGFIPFAALGDEKGTASYEMEVIVPAKSDFKSIPDLKGETIVFTTQDSNSGFKAPRYILQRDFNMALNKDYEFRFSGGHDVSIVGVSTGTYAAAAIANDVLARMVAKGHFDGSKVRSIYKSKPFPRAAIGFPYNLKPELADQIKSVILGFRFQGTSLQNAFEETHFVPIDFKRDWAIVREIDEASGVQYSME